MPVCEQTHPANPGEVRVAIPSPAAVKALGLAPGALAVLVARATPCILAHGQVSTGALAANAAMAVLTPALMALGILLT